MPSPVPTVTLSAIVGTGLALVVASVTLAAPAVAQPPQDLPAALTAPNTVDTAAKVATSTGKAGPLPQVVPAVLSIGSDDLPETRTDKQLAPGVVLTTIRRGDADSNRWVIRAVTIDPKVAEGRVGVTYGPTLAGNDRTTDLIADVDALVGINGSFFSPDTSRPGDPRGLTISDGTVLSEPSGYGSEVTLLVDSADNSMKVARLRWSATARNTSTGATLPITRVNAAPAGRQIVSITRDYGRRTPSGRGAEVVLDRDGCVVKIATSRGRELKRGQSSLQAVGAGARKLRKLAAKGCLVVEHEVRNRGKRVELTPSLSAMTGRVWLLNDGEITAPDRDRYLWRRHPRTIAGFTWDGKLVMLTVDGRSKESFGATMREAAAITRDLGLRDAMNLDGGGSTTLAVKGKVANDVTTERAVSDALVWLPKS